MNTLEGGVLQRTKTSKEAKALALVVSGGVFSGVYMDAAAQEIFDAAPPNVAGSRALPGYQPLGLRLGGVEVFPALEVGIEHDSNVYARSGNRNEVASDSAAIIEPRLRARKQWGSLRAEVSGRSLLKQYFEETSENRSDYSVNATLAGPIKDNTGFALNTSFNSRDAFRGTAENDLGDGAPIGIKTYSASLLLAHAFGRAKIAPQLFVTSTDYTSRDGGVIDQDFRDRTFLGGRLRASYDVSETAAFFATGTLAQYQYKDGRECCNRDSDYTALRGGISYNVTELITSSVSVGYRNNDFKSDNFSDFGGLSVRAEIDWYPTTLISVSLQADQNITTSNFEQISAVSQTRAAVSVNYELLRNLNLRTSFSMTHDNFENIDGSVNRYLGDFSATYKVNRNIGVEVKAAYSGRSANADFPLFNDSDSTRLTAKLVFAI